ncbi:hypothetical protein CPB97_006880 [Podila verticillata]|nr:hypothetical protein CPB97_006880 [Podila verticillata]
MAILRIISKFADKITLCTRTGFTPIDIANPLCAAGNILSGVINMADSVLRIATGFISTGLGALLDGVHFIICSAILRIPAVCDILQYLKEAVKKIVDWSHRPRQGPGPVILGRNDGKLHNTQLATV